MKRNTLRAERLGRKGLPEALKRNYSFPGEAIRSLREGDNLGKMHCGKQKARSRPAGKKTRGNGYQGLEGEKTRGSSSWAGRALCSKGPKGLDASGNRENTQIRCGSEEGKESWGGRKKRTDPEARKIERYLLRWGGNILKRRRAHLPGEVDQRERITPKPKKKGGLLT